VTLLKRDAPAAGAGGRGGRGGRGRRREVVQPDAAIMITTAGGQEGGAESGPQARLAHGSGRRGDECRGCDANGRLLAPPAISIQPTSAIHVQPTPASPPMVFADGTAFMVDGTADALAAIPESHRAEVQQHLIMLQRLAASALGGAA
jgi:hypothetical protein